MFRAFGTSIGDRRIELAEDWSNPRKSSVFELSLTVCFPRYSKRQILTASRLVTLTAILLVKVPLTTNRDRKLELGKGPRLREEVKKSELAESLEAR